MQENVAIVSESPCKSLEINKSLDKVKYNKEKEIKIKYHHYHHQKKRKRKVMMMTMMEYPMMHRQKHQKTLAAA